MKNERAELIQMAEMLAGYASTEDQKFYLYEPNDIPRLFHASAAKTRFLGGGNRSSKTYTHIIDYAAQFVGRAPKSIADLVPTHRLDQHRRLRICMEDYPNSFSKVIWPYIKSLVPADEIADTVKDSGRIRAITNKKSGFIEFMYYDQEVTKHQGTSRHSIGYDEEPPASIRDEGLMRLVDTDGEETFSLTPLSGALRYLYDDVFNKRGREVEKLYDITEDGKGNIVDAVPLSIVDRTIPGGDNDTHVFYACIFDNKVISKAAAIRILNKFPAEERNVRAKGHFMFLGGLVYKTYSDNVHLIQPLTGWQEDEDITAYAALDPHPRTPNAISIMLAHRNGMKYVADDVFIDSGAEGIANAVKVMCYPKVPELMLVDPSAWTPDPISRGTCLAYQLMDEFEKVGYGDMPLVRGSKDLTNGILAVKKELTPNAKGIPGFYITSNCINTRREITTWSWDDWKKDSFSKGEKQRPVDKNDHFMENLRRLLLFGPTFNPAHRRVREVCPTDGQ